MLFGIQQRGCNVDALTEYLEYKTCSDTKRDFQIISEGALDKTSGKGYIRDPDYGIPAT